MKIFLRYIKRQFYKLPYYGSRGDNAIYGKFKVRYSDGKTTSSMCWDVANDYAKMFDGKVIDNF